MRPTTIPSESGHRASERRWPMCFGNLLVVDLHLAQAHAHVFWSQSPLAALNSVCGKAWNAFLSP